MEVIKARNVNQALGLGLGHLLMKGKGEGTRNGAAIVAPGPVCTIYERPTERVLFGERRDANPFFHLFEALWMLGGRNDLAFPMYFNSNFGSYSDDGVTVHGAYGYRWRQQFGFDQLLHIVEELKENPHSRRAVLQMWSAPIDLVETDDGKGGLKSKDIPCNTHAYFSIRDGKLQMSVLNRSNDAIWGAYGANAVHFSILQEYMAAWLGVDVGLYYQISNNFHAYTGVYDCMDLELMGKQAIGSNHYWPEMKNDPKVKPFPLVTVSMDEWNADLKQFLVAPEDPHVYADPFFNNVAHPMLLAWKERKEKTGTGQHYIDHVIAEDWKLGCTQWIERREAKKVVS